MEMIFTKKIKLESYVLCTSKCHIVLASIDNESTTWRLSQWASWDFPDRSLRAGRIRRICLACDKIKVTFSESNSLPEEHFCQAELVVFVIQTERFEETLAEESCIERAQLLWHALVVGLVEIVEDGTWRIALLHELQHAGDA